MILSQSAVGICNLVQYTTLSLQYPARTIGIGCLYFVCKEIKCEVRPEQTLTVWRPQQGPKAALMFVAIWCFRG